MNRGDRFRERSGGAVGAYLARGRARVHVGAILSHTDALEALALDFAQTYADIAAQLGITPGHPYPRGEGHVDVPLFDTQGKVKRDAQGNRLYGEPTPEPGGNPVANQWWNATAKPTFDAWNVFKQDYLGDDLTVANAYIHWANLTKELDSDVLRSWHARLLAIRQGAGLVGLRLESPRPQDLQTTFIDDVKEAGSNVIHKVGEAWTLSKVLIYGGLALGAGLVVSSIVTNVRAGTDPATPYLQLAGRRR